MDIEGQIEETVEEVIEEQLETTEEKIEEVAEEVEKVADEVAELVINETGEDEKWNQLNTEISELKAETQATSAAILSLQTLSMETLLAIQALATNSPSSAGADDQGKPNSQETQLTGLQTEPLPPVEVVTDALPEDGQERKAAKRYRMV